MGDIPTPFKIPDHMKGDVAKHAPYMQKQMFKFMARSASGKSEYKERTFTDAPQLIRFLNENKLSITLHAVLPDFNSCRYIAIFEEEVE